MLSAWSTDQDALLERIDAIKAKSPRPNAGSIFTFLSAPPSTKEDRSQKEILVNGQKVASLKLDKNGGGQLTFSKGTLSEARLLKLIKFVEELAAK